jgi:hypothetical protein
VAWRWRRVCPQQYPGIAVARSITAALTALRSLRCARGIGWADSMHAAACATAHARPAVACLRSGNHAVRATRRAPSLS